MAEFGGNNINETVARILKTVMATELAKNYNLKGTKGKRKFEGLNLANILYRKYSFKISPVMRKPVFWVFQSGWTKIPALLGNTKDVLCCSHRHIGGFVISLHRNLTIV